MSYDLQFLKRRPGLTFEETMEALEGELESGNYDPAFVIDPPQIAKLILASGLEFEDPDIDPEMIELTPINHELAPIQITIDRGSIGVAIPNWDFSKPQISALRHYWDSIHPILTSAGLVGYDSQQDAEITGNTFQQIITGTTQGAATVRAFMAKDKPWWKFW